jgi:hypothetical protein
MSDAIAEIRNELRALRELASRQNLVLVRMITTREAERVYRLAHGTVAADYKAGKIRGRKRSSRGRNGESLFVSPTDCERLYGAAYVGAAC